MLIGIFGAAFAWYFAWKRTGEVEEGLAVRAFSSDEFKLAFHSLLSLSPRELCKSAPVEGAKQLRGLDGADLASALPLTAERKTVCGKFVDDALANNLHRRELKLEEHVNFRERLEKLAKWAGSINVYIMMAPLALAILWPLAEVKFSPWFAVAAALAGFAALCIPAEGLGEGGWSMAALAIVCALLAFSPFAHLVAKGTHTQAASPSAG